LTYVGDVSAPGDPVTETGLGIEIEYGGVLVSFTGSMLSDGDGSRGILVGGEILEFIGSATGQNGGVGIRLLATLGSFIGDADGKTGGVGIEIMNDTALSSFEGSMRGVGADSIGVWVGANYEAGAIYEFIGDAVGSQGGKGLVLGSDPLLGGSKGSVSTWFCTGPSSGNLLYHNPDPDYQSYVGEVRLMNSTARVDIPADIRQGPDIVPAEANVKDGTVYDGGLKEGELAAGGGPSMQAI
jgi:hypothetical protein